MPPLYEAIQRMRQINKRDIAELKSLHHPPIGVRRVMECVSVLLGRYPTIPTNATKEQMDHLHWMEAQRTMGDFGFLQKLIDFDRERITESLINTIHGCALDEKCREMRACVCVFMFCLHSFRAVMLYFAGGRALCKRKQREDAVMLVPRCRTLNRTDMQHVFRCVRVHRHLIGRMRKLLRTLTHTHSLGGGCDCPLALFEKTSL